MPSLSAGGGDENRATFASEIRVGVSLDLEMRVAGDELFTTVGELSSEATPGIPSRLMLCGKNSRFSSLGGSGDP